jgi:type IV pilus assembly protein PilB
MDNFSFSNKLNSDYNPNTNITAYATAAANFKETSNANGNTIAKANSEAIPLIQFLNNLLLEAVQQRVSDLHFELYENYYRLRSRRDGILYETTHLPLKLAPQIASRLKILSNLDISERRLPQDGRFKISALSNNPKYDSCDFSHINFRISSCPTLFGEKIVVRILDFKQTQFNIDELGFEPFQKVLLLQHLYKPQGMILVTGPTGSGKTLSLYTAINLLNTSERNILSCEDPVEIYLPGINQVNINLKAGLNFPNTLRAFLRQDPDVIMLGEIRDLETAEIAVKAAQTGHLVLSTLHTNSAIETINRLMHMGVANFNLASALTLVIAQRLARRLCQFCKIELPQLTASQISLQMGFVPEDIQPLSFFGPNPTGCEACQNGYNGRIGVYELLPISSELQMAILKGSHTIDLQKKAEQQGMWNLKQAAFNKVKQGITSLEEIQRVILD